MALEAAVFAASHLSGSGPSRSSVRDASGVSASLTWKRWMGLRVPTPAKAFDQPPGCGRRPAPPRTNARAIPRAALADVAQEASSAEAPELPFGSSWSVHKFGGTCVGSPERIANVARIIATDPSARKLVVVSAMAKVTNALYSLLDTAARGEEDYVAQLDGLWQKHKDAATELLGEGNPDLAALLERLQDDVGNLRAMLKAIFIARNATETFSDFVVGHGELWSAQILSATVRKVTGAPCAFLDARDVLVVQAAEGGKQVDPDYLVSQSKLNKWYAETAARAGELPPSSAPRDVSTIVATGFIARTPEGVPTTLKRDGSDFSAAIFGSLLRAGRVTIWTDVSGVYSADPRKVPEAVVLRSLSYQEAWEMSYFGASVLHPRTTMPVMRFGIPMFIRNAFSPDEPGTRIGASPDCVDGEEECESEEPQKSSQSVVKGFATIDNVALLNVEGTGMAGVPGTASQIFTAVKNVGANVIAISQASSEHSVCFAVPESEADTVARALAETFERAIESGRISNIGVIRQCCVLAAVGQRMASTPGVSATVFTALAKANVNIRAIAQGCSEYNITAIIDQSDSVKALRAVHSRFYSAHTALSVILVGPGLIGGTLLEQMRERKQELLGELGLDLRVVAIVGGSRMLVDPMGLELDNWRERLASEGVPSDVRRAVGELVGVMSLPNPAVVDCTASEDVAGLYGEWAKLGVHVVTPNKKAGSGPLGAYQELKALQRQAPSSFFLTEATVGAGLPIISTLRGLLDTGDKVVRIEGIFSGTLSYIFNTWDGQKPFSQIVAEARAAGYTEPDPRDDLAGMDVARKVAILAREAGLMLDLSHIPVHSLVPEPLCSVLSAEEYLSRLPEFDGQMEGVRREAEASGEVLRYVGVVDMEKREGRVELNRYPQSHPFAQLSGSDNIISFTTSRYRKQPLIVRGPGAGAEVTAGGVFSDLLRLASFLGSPV